MLEIFNAKYSGGGRDPLHDQISTGMPRLHTCSIHGTPFVPLFAGYRALTFLSVHNIGVFDDGTATYLTQSCIFLRPILGEHASLRKLVFVGDIFSSKRTNFQGKKIKLPALNHLEFKDFESMGDIVATLGILKAPHLQTLILHNCDP